MGGQQQHPRQLGVFRAPSKRTREQESAEADAAVPPLRCVLVATPPDRGVTGVLVDCAAAPRPAARANGCRVGEVVVIDASQPLPRVVRHLDASEALEAMQGGHLGADLYALHLRHAA